MYRQKHPDYFEDWLTPTIHLLRRLCAGGGTLTIVLIAMAQATSAATFRYANSSNRIYVEGGGSATLTDILAALPNAPLTLIDPANKIWFLAANLVVTDGSVLTIQGGSSGDVNELRLKSNNSSAADSYVCIDADWGVLNFVSTKVTSWNEATSAPDKEHDVYQRAYIRARSRQTGSVVTESTLNVVNSEIAYLGYNFREGFGLTWQIVSSVTGVRVFGTVSGSNIHDCELGVETWQADDVAWSGNEIAYNTLYGYLASDPAVQAVLATNNVHDNDFGATFRWASSSNRIYVTGPGVASLSDIKSALPSAPLTVIDAAQGIWYLSANLFVENGAKLKIHGMSIDGDVNELRLKSENSAAADSYIEIRADWGWLDIRSTKITSWNNAVNGPDTETDTYRRAFIRARSTLDPDGVTAHESRMDIIDSDIGFLGSHNTEAYGLVWKVVDTTAVYLPPGEDLFDHVEVYGDILNSRLHHNYFGMYSYGLLGGHWANNEVDHNIGYGFDPHDDSDFLVIENNNVHHNGWHGIIASKRCNNGVMRNNVSWANGKNGLMLHRTSDDWIVEGNLSYDNGDSGMSIFGCRGITVRNNEFTNNGNAGVRLSVGAHENLIEENLIDGSGKYGFYLYQGSDTPNPGDDGRNSHNIFRNNIVRNCANEAIKSTSSDENDFVSNQLENNGDTLRFTESVGNLLQDNIIVGDVTLKNAGSASVPTLTYVTGQPVMKIRVDDFSQVVFYDDLNHFTFDPDESNLATTALIDGTYLTLGAAQVGTTSTVLTRPLSVTPDQEPVLVNPLTWATSGDLEKSFSITAPIGTAMMLGIGDLAANSTYRLLADAVQIGTVSTDAFGVAQTTVLVSSSANVVYSVVP